MIYIPKELENTGDESHRRSGCEGKHSCVIALGCLAPLRGPETGIPTKDNPVEYCSVGMIRRQGIHMRMHPLSYLVGDHIGCCGMDFCFWNVVMMIEMKSTWLDFGAGHAILLDCVGLEGRASSGVTLDEGYDIACKEVVLHMDGLELQAWVYLVVL